MWILNFNFTRKMGNEFTPVMLVISITYHVSTCHFAKDIIQLHNFA